MNWENHGQGEGKWNIDHITPVKYPGKAGGEPTLEEVVARLYWTNCQPMWAIENIAKGNRFIGRVEHQEPVGLPQGPQLTDDEVTGLMAELGI